MCLHDCLYGEVAEQHDEEDRGSRSQTSIKGRFDRGARSDLADERQRPDESAELKR